MKLLIGGIFSGKYERLLALGLSPDQIADGSEAAFADAFAKPALYRLNVLIRRLLAAGVDPMEFVLENAVKNPSITIACDEVGGGVVPIDREEREYREAVGRICCKLAEKASRVERIYCGIPTVLKAEDCDGK
ncbi:MAG: bifunctional adenosylcobinamide kinase/adenosylcobinamide-phosphate guanylyltransferase [Candidatus Merdivicinus sp.]|jgi:adenosylcobinamide kinase/adenosylcobinamide-phosphate guanylyltransferase